MLELERFLAGPSVHARTSAAVLRISGEQPALDEALRAGIAGLAATAVARSVPGARGSVAALGERLITASTGGWGRASVAGEALVVPAPSAALAALLTRGLEAIASADHEAWGALLPQVVAALVYVWEAPAEVAELVEAARRRGISARWPSPNVVALGEGARSRSFVGGRLSGQPALTAVLDDKAATADLLRALGLPAPVHYAVDDADTAVAAARALGFPVVIKPAGAQNQIGVHLGLDCEARVRSAWTLTHAALGARGGAILVERQVSGTYLRVTLVGGRVAAALTSAPPTVVADGRSSYRALLCQAWGGDGEVALDPRTDSAFAGLAHGEGLRLEDVPAAGRVLPAGLDSHGPTRDVTSLLHPSWKRALARLGRAIPLPAIGVDLLVRGPDQPLDPDRDVILEVNAAPAFTLHGRVDEGRRRPLGRRVLDVLWPRGAADARVTVVAGAAARIEALAAAVPGIAGYTRGEAWIGDPSGLIGAGPGAAHALALHPELEIVGLEIDEALAFEAGLPFDHVDHVLGTLSGPAERVVRGLRPAERWTSTRALATRLGRPR